MANDMNADAAKWPTEIGEKDDLYAVVDTKSNETKYLVFSSSEKQSLLVRSDGNWIKASTAFLDEIDDPDFANRPVEVPFIDYYDTNEKAGGAIKFTESPAQAAVTAAAEDDVCPPATQDIAVNLRNRNRAILAAGYGPLNPKEQNTKFWASKAELWSITIDEAKKSLCGNCVMFTVTTKMKDCIATGIEQGGSGEQNAWDAIDQAELGYCEAFDFKCAASRTCDAWVTGGPISDDIKSDRGVA